MYLADTKHSKQSLQDKLAGIYTMRPDSPAVDLRIREPYLKLLEKLGNPQDRLPPVIHVAGTNGKGSVIANIRAIMVEAGYKPHIYTSPHLYKFNERIVLGGREIMDEVLEELLDNVLEVNNGEGLTFFEITTALAFSAFARYEGDILLLETGLGGRLDCSNVVKEPLVTIITNIGYDHMEYLGETIELIAAEKAGIIKQNCPCIIAPQDFAEVYDVIEGRAKSLNAPVYRVMAVENEPVVTSNMTGSHQVDNSAVALKAIDLIENFIVSKLDIERGLQKVHWPARLQQIERVGGLSVLSDNCEIWYDGGHNEGAGRALAAQAKLWYEQDGKKLTVIIGMMRGKDPVKFITPMLPYIEHICCIDIAGHDSAFSSGELRELLVPVFSGSVTAKASLQEAIGAVSADTRRVLVAGSLYLAASVKNIGE